MKAIVGIGSNIEPRRNLESACQRLARDADVVKLSRPWWTPAVGGAAGDPPFLNCIAVVDTPRRPVALRRWLQAIELDHRRIRTHDRNAPRTLDLDVLALDDGSGSGWQVDADLPQQPFHLLPLREVLPELRLPDGRTVRQAAEDHPLPAAVPWVDAGLGRRIERPATLEGR
jgi:2-amino-4-hydroxy-6-hydroxymethyldihydropteridine diphosphokinase